MPIILEVLTLKARNILKTYLFNYLFVQLTLNSTECSIPELAELYHTFNKQRNFFFQYLKFLAFSSIHQLVLKKFLQTTFVMSKLQIQYVDFN